MRCYMEDSNFELEDDSVTDMEQLYLQQVQDWQEYLDENIQVCLMQSCYQSIGAQFKLSTSLSILILENRLRLTLKSLITTLATQPLF